MKKGLNKKPKISLIIPVYNEKEGIKKFIGRLNFIIHNSDFECIIVDDGSDDGTSQELEKLKNINGVNSFNSIKVITHKLNKGYGASLKTGIRNSKGKVVCIIDGDGSYVLEDILKLIPYLENNDMVVGARPYKLFPVHQKIAKYLVSKLLSFIFSQNVGDINSGLRVMKKSSIISYFPLLSERFSFTAGSTLTMLIDKKKIIYVPIKYNKRVGKTKVRKVSYTWNFIKSYIRIFYNLKLKRKK